MPSLFEKVALVTGASSGIGRAITLSLAQSGMKVIGLARREEKVKELATDACKGSIEAIKCNLSDEADIKKAFDQVERSYGTLDVLVNSAGVLKLGRLTDGNTQDWRSTLDINVLALSICTREAIRIMKKKNSVSQIIHINSVAGHTVPNYQGVSFGLYCPSKYAVTALTETLRVELQGLSSNIKVTVEYTFPEDSISPGSVHTNMVRKISADLQGKKFEESEQFEKRPYSFLDPKDIADGVMYVLSTPPHVQVHELTIMGIGHKFS